MLVGKGEKNSNELKAKFNKKHDISKSTHFYNFKICKYLHHTKAHILI